MSDRYDYDTLTGKSKSVALGIARKASTSYSFVRQPPETEFAGETERMSARRDAASQRKREAKQAPHATSDLSMDGGLRERRSLLNGITQKHRCQGSTSCKCGKLAAQPVRGLGMKHFMRDVVAQGRRRHWKSVRQVNAHNRAGALLATVNSGDLATLKAVAPLLRNHVKVIRKDERGLI